MLLFTLYGTCGVNVASRYSYLLKRVRGKMVREKMVPRKMVPKKIGPRKNGPQKRMLGNLNDFCIFIN